MKSTRYLIWKRRLFWGTCYESYRCALSFVLSPSRSKNCFCREPALQSKIQKSRFLLWPWEFMFLKSERFCFLQKHFHSPNPASAKLYPCRTSQTRLTARHGEGWLFWFSAPSKRDFSKIRKSGFFRSWECFWQKLFPKSFIPLSHLWGSSW